MPFDLAQRACMHAGYYVHVHVWASVRNGTNPSFFVVIFENADASSPAALAASTYFEEMCSYVCV